MLQPKPLPPDHSSKSLSSSKRELSMGLPLALSSGPWTNATEAKSVRLLVQSSTLSGGAGGMSGGGDDGGVGGGAGGGEDGGAKGG